MFALGAGTLADAVDRRRLLLVTQTAQAIGTGLLFVLALSPAPPVIAIFAVAFLMASLGSVDQPARASSIPRLCRPSDCRPPSPSTS